MTERTSLEIVAVVDEGLGHSAHLLHLGTGNALVVDPLRDIATVVAAADARGWRIVAAADTHVHADYVSGGPEFAGLGASYWAPAAAGLLPAHRGIAPGECIDAGAWVIEAVPTPGHTPHHLSYLVRRDDEPVALFSGGSLMVGTVGRPDLFGPSRTESLARQMYRTLRDRLMTLPDALPVHPTHGPGSFCSAPGTGERTTTIGRERATNPVVGMTDEDAFVQVLTAQLGTFPSYYALLPEVNLRGADRWSRAELAPLSIEQTREAIEGGAEVVDVRSVLEFAEAHVPGSLSIPLRPQLASWLGWLVPRDRPIIFVTSAATDKPSLLRQAANIGYDNLLGEVEAGVDGWKQSGGGLGRLELREAQQLSGPLLDVRQAAEFRAGHIPGAKHLELGSLPQSVRSITSPVTTMCGHGERACTAASILRRAGLKDVAVFVGGPGDWERSSGGELEVGP